MKPAARNAILVIIEEAQKGVEAGVKMFEANPAMDAIRRIQTNVKVVLQYSKILEAEQNLKDGDLIETLNRCGEVLKEYPNNQECIRIVRLCLKENPNIAHHLEIFGIKLSPRDVREMTGNYNIC